MTDPIADMLTRLRNAVSAKHTRVDMPASRLKADIARILQDEGYIQGFKLLDDANGAGPVKTLRVFLKYTSDRRPVITGLRRVSRPGSRRYLSVDEIRPVVGGLGISIMTTPRGVMTGRLARKERLGGEILCEVW